MATEERIDLEERAKDALPDDVAEQVDAIDLRIAGWAEKYGITLLRLTVGLVYIWFGVLKVIDKSPVEDFVRDVAFYLPDSVVVPAMGGWEIIIGLGLIFPVALRITLAMLWVQLIGTFSAFIVVPGQCFQDYNPVLLTTTGEFVLKNIVLIAAGVVIGSTVRVRSRRVPATRSPAS